MVILILENLIAILLISQNLKRGETVSISLVIMKVNNLSQTHNELEHWQMQFCDVSMLRKHIQQSNKNIYHYRDVILFSFIINLNIISPT